MRKVTILFILLILILPAISQQLNFEIDPYFQSFNWERGVRCIFYGAARKVNIEYDFGTSGWKSICVGIGGTGRWNGDYYDGYFAYTGKKYHIVQMNKFNLSVGANGGVAYNSSDRKPGTYEEVFLNLLLFKVFFIKVGNASLIFSKDTYLRIYTNPYIGFGGTINF